jgi:polyhydroxyalkanoate synthesis regulator protein
LVKRYAQSRFYDATNLRYVPVEHLREWAAEGAKVSIVDAEDGKDVTDIVLD